MTDPSAFQAAAQHLDASLLDHEYTIPHGAWINANQPLGGIRADLELLRTEQDRIPEQLEVIAERLLSTAASFDRIEINLTLALDFAGNCHEAYLRASDHVRRLFNQAFFTKVYIDEGDEVRACLAEPFRSLLDEEVIVAPSASRKRRRFLGQGRDDPKRKLSLPAGVDQLAGLGAMCSTSGQGT